MYTRHFPPFFGTTTIFANQLGYSTSLMNPTASSLSTLAWMIFCLSGWKHLTLYQIGREEGIILSRCEATKEWILGISEWVHVKTSSFCRSTASSISYFSGASKELTWVTHSLLWERHKGNNGLAADGSLSVGLCNCYCCSMFVCSMSGLLSLEDLDSCTIW